MDQTSLLLELSKVAALAALSTGALAVAVYKRRADGSRRWLLGIVGFIGTVMTVLIALTGAAAIAKIGARNSLLAITATLALAGLYLLRRGIQGRRVGDHPHCRKCRYDLFGRPEGVHVCGECGADLNHSRAILTGTYQSIKPLVIAGFFLTLLGLSLSLPEGLRLARRVDWAAQLPTWALVRLADPMQIDSSWTRELADRAAAGSMSPSQFRMLADRVLKLEAQGHNTQEWQAVLLVFSRDFTVFDDVVARRLLRSTVESRLYCSQRWARDQRLVIRPIAGFRDFGGLRGIPIPKTTFQVISLSVGSFQLSPSEIRARTEDDHWGGKPSSITALELNPTTWAQIPNGTSRLTATFDVTVVLEHHDRQLIEKFTLEASSSVRIAPAKDLRPKLVAPTTAELQAEWSARIRTDQSGAEARTTLEIFRRPAPNRVLARVVAVTSDRREIELGTVHMRSNHEVATLDRPFDASAIETETWWLELRPDPDIDEQFLDTTPILDQLVVISDVHSVEMAQ